MMIDLDPKALAMLRAKAAWDNAAPNASADDVLSTGRAWREAKCPIEIPAPDRAGFVRVRIAVIVGPDGGWIAGSGSGCPDDLAARALRSEAKDGRISYVEAWVPKPAGPETVEGEVSDGS